MKWRCIICGYIHEGDQPPHKCPVCGAPAKLFEPLAADHAGQSREPK
jgi:rubrerythrin